jgi:adenylyl-sulfate kinase
MTAKIIWLTGLSGSGKTTIAKHLNTKLKESGKKVINFDGDEIRSKFNKNLKFTPQDIKENNLFILNLCQEYQSSYDYILVPVIAPFKETRDNARKTLSNNYLEVFVNTPLEECIRRDVKGLYKKALNGGIKNFIGIDSNTPYQEPINPDISILTKTTSVEKAVSIILSKLSL